MRVSAMRGGYQSRTALVTKPGGVKIGRVACLAFNHFVNRSPHPGEVTSVRQTIILPSNRLFVNRNSTVDLRQMIKDRSRGGGQVVWGALF